MATTTTSTVITLKLLVDKKGQRVLFAEAGKDFVDFLFSLLVLPVGTIVRLLKNRDMVGGFAELHKSVSDLKNDYTQPNWNNQDLLKPNSFLPEFSQRLLNPTEGFPMISSYCMYCSDSRTGTVDPYGRGFVKESVTFMVSDDLVVSPMPTMSSITLLNKFNIKNLGAIEERVVDVGQNETKTAPRGYKVGSNGSIETSMVPSRHCGGCGATFSVPSSVPSHRAPSSIP
ncbi:hypothetical protein SSX86_020467 [Deinandra increscens subsp. villosa]|uniref:DUF674 domain-containing protein n=1 Tax=Deinandra increscens subsp. villosa TaxID=3103831 RepID=A0AAP0CSG3_9ASTR